MDESDLYKCALVSVLMGFLMLGFIVLFVPLTFSDSSADFIDGMVVSVFPAQKGGQVILISQVEEKSLFLEKEMNIYEGSLYRFYNPSGSDLLVVSDARPLT